ncbi:MAG TPA: GNAT family N-acetyltransferase [Candidatus Tectomicrobia bacterium]|jgi:hypothetical protein|nr:GNAT family N-acetyltransferase [Candidatus Tectomicrobia bacterium]
MLDSCTIVERLPTVEEYVRLIAAVGFRPRQREAIALALQHSWFSVCAESEGEAVGMGRVIGDGGLHLYLTDVIVHPAPQRRGHCDRRGAHRVGGRGAVSEHRGRPPPHAQTRRLLSAPWVYTAEERQPGDADVGQPADRGVTGTRAGHGPPVNPTREIPTAVALCLMLRQARLPWT